MTDIPRLLLTSGEPAGIGPDLILAAATRSWPAELVCVGSRELLTERSVQLGLDIVLKPYGSGRDPVEHVAGQLWVVDIPLGAPCTPGVLDTRNASYVLATLTWAVDACTRGEGAAMVTAPVQKSVIADAGVAFSGHTEFLAQATDTPEVVMLLAAGELRVALATTHLPLAKVPAAITQPALHQVLDILTQALREQFGIPRPRIAVLGLNPHAGEGGHLGREEIDTITPVCNARRAQGEDLLGPLPADTAFNTEIRQGVDAYLAMYHDQGLPVLKFAGFGEAVNITLGLPLIRTSVDHGTALDLAGTGKARPESLYAAIQQAIVLGKTRNAT